MVAFNREYRLQRITEILSHIKNYIQLRNSIKRFDINIEVEDFCMKLLNLVYDYELINANAEKSNMPGIDLLDYGNRIAVQVTSQTDSKKVQHSLDEYLKHELYHDFDRLIVFMLQDKQTSYTVHLEKSTEYLEFSVENDIQDITTLLGYIDKRCSDPRMNKILKFLEDQVPTVFPKTYVEKMKDGKRVAQEYRSNWEKLMFLENYDDPNAKKLCDIYQQPEYQILEFPERKKLIKERKAEIQFKNTQHSISEFFIGNITKKGFGLILGLPGIGKSTLFSWLLNQKTLEKSIMFKIWDEQEISFGKKDIFLNQDLIYLHRFTEIKDKIWEKEDVDDIVDELICIMKSDTDDDIDGKIFLWDGFDEVRCDRLRDEIIKNFHYETRGRCTVFVTCRENYFTGKELSVIREVDIIRLRRFNNYQIDNYIKTYTGKDVAGEDANLLSIINKTGYQRIFGLPVVLYMVLSVFSENQSKFDTNDITLYQVYEKIFSLDGGIYDRMAKNGRSWNAGDNRLHNKTSVNEMKIKLHKVSKNIGSWMFNNNTELCPGIVVRKIIEKNELSLGDLSGGLFRLKYFEIAGEREIDGSKIDFKELHFVHRTIFEYFAAKAIAEEIEKATSEISSKNIRKARKELGRILFEGDLLSNTSKNIVAFLTEALSGESLSCVTRCFEEMLVHGMIDSTEDWFCTNKEYVSMSIWERGEKEYVCFLNMLKIIQIIRKNSNENERVILNLEDPLIRNGLEKYLSLRSASDYEDCDLLNNFVLSGCSFDNKNLSGYNLSNSILDGCSFLGAKLAGTKLPQDIIVHEKKRFVGASMMVNNKNNLRIMAKNIYIGKLITFGRYPYTKEEGNESWTPITWRILDIRGNAMLLLSDRILDVKKYQRKKTDFSWMGCYLQRWLNEEFLDSAFNEEEQDLIEEQKCGKIFLLTIEEVYKYFCAYGFENAEFAHNRVINVGGNQAMAYPTTYVDSMIQNGNKESSLGWWLMKKGSDKTASFVCEDGTIHRETSEVDQYQGIRPALWLELK